MLINPYLQEDNKEKVKKNNEESIINKCIDYIIKTQKKLVLTSESNRLRQKIEEYILEKKRDCSKEELSQIANDILNKIYGYSILQEYIDDDITSDIRAVGYDRIYVKQRGIWIKSNKSFMNDKEYQEFIHYSIIKNDANINFEKPIVIVSDRTNNLRIEAGLNPVNISNSNIIIRMHKNTKNKTLENLCIKESMFPIEIYKKLLNIIKDLKNIIFVGKGGSGKTTLLRAVLDKIPEEIPITSNEETSELNISRGNIVQREVTKRRNEKEIDLEMLTRHSLVMSNDVIVIGELKGKEANTFFDAISTGHAGYTTLHANSVNNSISRLIVLIKKDIRAQGYSEHFLKTFIASSIDYIVYMKDYKIIEIAKVELKEDNINIKSMYKIKKNKIRERESRTSDYKGNNRNKHNITNNQSNN
ncbi:MAG: ATPase, T2SS/T4P/T4SS family [Clostridia bacterium]|nr:ATPase, T2SS/T4P/T4SS family [Clostridia bacterium]MDD4375283.1 ATPase, T2SS/T4P/T4SS family [Clostridia bacterium]